MCAHTSNPSRAVSSPALPFIFFLFAGYLCLTLSIFLVTSVVYAVSNFCLACRLPFHAFHSSSVLLSCLLKYSVTIPVLQARSSPPPPNPLTLPPRVTRDGPCAVALLATALNQRKRRGKHGFHHRHPQTGSAQINMHMLRLSISLFIPLSVSLSAVLALVFST